MRLFIGFVMGFHKISGCDIIYFLHLQTKANFYQMHQILKFIGWRLDRVGWILKQESLQLCIHLLLNISSQIKVRHYVNHRWIQVTRSLSPCKFLCHNLWYTNILVTTLFLLNRMILLSEVIAL